MEEETELNADEDGAAVSLHLVVEAIMKEVDAKTPAAEDNGDAVVDSLHSVVLETEIGMARRPSAELED
jgi:hypothetical protein